VTESDIEKKFGLSCSSLKVTCPCFHANTKQEFFRLYWQVFGTPHVTNNEFNVWFVRGYIAHEKGENINWARAIASTIRKKNLKRKSTHLKQWWINGIL
jgi:hypothetical protein